MKDVVSVAAWNIHGLKSKVTDSDFINLIEKYDIVLLSETWLSVNESCMLNGFEHVLVNRPRRNRAGRNSGGLAVYYKSHIKRGVTITKIDPCGIIWLKLSRQFFSLESDIYISHVYIPPISSTFYLNNDKDFFFRALENDINMYKEIGIVLNCGDFNARTSNEHDFIPVENSTNPINTSVSYDDSVIPMRTNEDQSVNNFGRRLLDLCVNTGQIIANGRAFSDAGVGRFTCFTPNGSSVVDYLLLPPEQFSHIHEFCVMEPTVLSDHACIEFSIVTNNFCNELASNCYSRDVPTIKWLSSDTDKYKSDIIGSLPYMREIIDNYYTDGDINELVELMSAKIYDIGYNSFGRIIKVGGKTHTKSNPWFDHECHLAKSAFCKERNTYKRNRNDHNRNKFITTRSAYVKAKKCAIRKYKNIKGRELSKIAKHDSKKFWSSVKKMKEKTKKNVTTPNSEQFKIYFQNLFGDAPGTLQEQTSIIINEANNEYTSNLREIDALDKPITASEIVSSIGKLKRNKGSGSDNLISEMFMEVIDNIIPILEKLFNILLERGVFPKSWSTGIIVPIPKAGDLSDPGNFRAICISSVFGKIFSSIINNRLLTWAEENGKLNANQFGFRPNRSTTDCVFILQSIIEDTLAKKQDLLCAFVDFQKAFDKVNRDLLYYKLWSIGASTKIIKLVKCMYSSVEICVKHDHNVSETFMSYQGVKQGEPMSPLLFLFFINDFMSNYTPNNPNDLISIETIILFSLLFADDAALFAKSEKELQNQLDHLGQYCKKWNITVNINKTKIVIFTKKRRPFNFEFQYNGNVIEQMDSFTYLGVNLHKSGSCKYAQIKQAKQGGRALGGLMQILNTYDFTINTQLNMFDTLVTPVLTYGAEVWGFQKGEVVERVHVKFCRRILQVPQRASNNFMYGDLNRVSMSIRWKEKILRYWTKIISDTNTLIFHIYKHMRLECERTGRRNWASNVRDLLFELGLNNYWFSQDISHISVPLMIQRLHDQYQQCWHNSVILTSKLHFYAKYKTTMNIATYLSLSNHNSRRLIALIRSGTCKIEIENGRMQGTNREQRLCLQCNQRMIEDEYHFVLVCPKYRDLRLNHLPKYYTKWPTLQKFINLMSSDSVRTQSMLGIYLKQALMFRNNI